MLQRQIMVCLLCLFWCDCENASSIFHWQGKLPKTLQAEFVIWSFTHPHNPISTLVTSNGSLLSLFAQGGWFGSLRSTSSTKESYFRYIRHPSNKRNDMLYPHCLTLVDYKHVPGKVQDIDCSSGVTSFTPPSYQFQFVVMGLWKTDRLFSY